MSVWLGGLPYTSLGALQIRPRPAGGIASTYPRVGPQAVDPAMEACFIEDAGVAVPVTARNVGGFCYTDDGAMYVTTDTSTGPFTYISGQKVRQDGAVCLISKTPTPGTDPYIGGVALDAATGAEIVNTLSFAFMATFADAGAGAVRTNLLFGTGSATFTRATIATTVGPTGLVVAVGTGVARSYYDPTTLAYRGYLAEGARTNLCLQSEDFSTWVTANSSITVNTSVAPDGNTTADTLNEDATAGVAHPVSQLVAKAASALAYSFSVYVKPAGRTWTALTLFDNVSVGTRYWFNLTGAGAVGSTAAIGAGFTAASASIQSLSNGWYRCTMNATSNAVASLAAFLYSTDADLSLAPAAGLNGAGLRLWGAQLEQATFASSYIPTTTVSVTRNADVLTYASAGNANAATGTAYAELSTEWALSPSAPIAVGFGAAVHALKQGTGQADTQVLISDGVVNTATKSGLSSTSTGIRKRASSWGTGLSITGDGLAVATSAFDGAMDLTEIDVGCITGGTNQWFGTIKNVMISQSQLTDAQLQALTNG